MNRVGGGGTREARRVLRGRARYYYIPSNTYIKRQGGGRTVRRVGERQSRCRMTPITKA